MADEVAIATRMALWVTVRFCAWQFANVLLLFKVVADISTHSALIGWLAWRIVHKVGAVLVFAVLLRAGGPRVENLISAWDVLGNDEAGVEVHTAKSVFVVGRVWIECHGKTGL